jgi:hypothetical protein
MGDVVAHSRAVDARTRTREAPAPAGREPAKPRKPPAPRNTWQPAFLAALRETGNVRVACQAARVERGTAYAARRRSERFAQAWDAAVEESGDVLEAAAHRYGVLGWDEPVFGIVVDSNGNRVTAQVGTRHRHDSRLLALLLQGAKPDKYGRRVVITDEALERERDELETRVRGLRAIRGGAAAQTS